MATLITNPSSYETVALPAAFHRRSIGPREGIIVTDELSAVTDAIVGLPLTAEALVGGAGDIISSGATTDNAVARWNGTSGLLLQNSSALLADTGALLLSSVSPDAAALSVVANSLTTGNALSVSSTSADSEPRTLVSFHNANGPETTLLRLSQNAAAATPALDVSGRSTFTSDQTSGNLVRITTSELGTGAVLRVDSSATNLGAKNLVSIENSNTGASGTVALDILNLGTGPTAKIVGATTAGNVLAIEGDSLTSGKLLSLFSVSGSATYRDLMTISNNNETAIATNLMRLTQLSAGGAILVIAESTTSPVVSVQANSLTNAAALSVTSNSGSTAGRALIDVVNDSAAATAAIGIRVRQDAATAAALSVQTTASGALAVDVALQSTGTALRVLNPGTTTGYAVSLTGCDSLTSGGALEVRSNSANTGARVLVDVEQGHASGIGTTALRISQAANYRAIDVVANAVTASNAVLITADGLTSGSALRVVSNSANTSARPIAKVLNDNLFAIGTIPLELQQEADQVSLNLTGAGGGGIQFQEVAAVPGGAPSAGRAKFWVRNAVPNVPMFTDDAGVDREFALVAGASLSGFTTADNTGLGQSAGNLLDTGTGNVFVGVGAGQSIETTNGNTLIGHFAGSGTIGSDNTIIGYNSSQTLYSGSNNIVIGSATDIGPSISGTIVIGRSSTGGSASSTLTNGFFLHRSIVAADVGTAVIYKSSTGQVGPVSKTMLVVSDATTENSVVVTSDALTTGAGLIVKSASTATDTRTIAEIKSSSSLATGTSVLSVSQAANQVSIDLTGSYSSVQFQSVAAVPGGTPASGKGKIWFRDTTPAQLAFTNSAGDSVRIGPSLFSFGNSSVLNNTSTAYLNPFFSSAAASSTEIAFRVPFACRISNMFYHAAVAQTVVSNTVTTRLNGVDTSLVVSVAADAANASNTADSFTAAQGDSISISVVGSGSSGSGVTHAVVTYMAVPLV